MNFLKKLFGMKSESVTPVSAAMDLPEQSVRDIDQDLFIDHSEPHTPAAVKVNPIKEFLSKDYRSMGNHDGYNYHSGDVLKSKVRCLTADYRNLLDEHSETLSREVKELRTHRAEIEGLSGRMVKKIDLEIEELTQALGQMMREKELSAVEEGLVMSVVHQYRDGFIRGIEDYQMQKLFGGSSGLFN